jgi:hypothetical protein
MLGRRNRKKRLPKGRSHFKRKPESSGLDFLMWSIFTKACSLWERYQGDVPQSEVEVYDRAGDFPHGVAAAALRRLNEDRSFRSQLQKLQKE